MPDRRPDPDPPAAAGSGRSDLGALARAVEERVTELRRRDPRLGLEPPWRAITAAWQRELYRLGTPTLVFAAAAGVLVPGWSGTGLLVLAAVLALLELGLLARNAALARRRRAEGMALPVAVVQAADALWEFGEVPSQAAGQVLFSFDETIRRDPARLVALGEELRARVHAADPLLSDALRRRVLSGVVGRRRLRLPTELTGGAMVLLADCLLRRDRLPAGHLDRSVYFVLAHPDLTRGGVEQLPLALWWSPEDNDLTVV